MLHEKLKKLGRTLHFELSEIPRVKKSLKHTYLIILGLREYGYTWAFTHKQFTASSRPFVLFLPCGPLRNDTTLYRMYPLGA